MKPTPEQFEIWLADETTQYVLAGLQKMADAQKAAWAEHAWVGNLDQDFYSRAKERARAFSEMAAPALPDVIAWNGDTV